MSKKQIGGTVRERRGEDYFNFYTTDDGDIVEVQQYDAIGHRWEAINFFAETAPNMIAMIQKAAGIKAEKVEYEYACQLVDANGDGYRITEREWFDDRKIAELMVKQGTEDNAKEEAKWGKNGMTFRLVKRRKAGNVEIV